MAEHGGKAPPKKGAEKKSGGGFWSFLGDALRNVSIDVDRRGRPGAPSRNPTDPASRMEPVRSERDEAYQETIYRKTEGGDGIAPAVRVNRDRQAIARSLDNRMGAQAETKVPESSGSPLSRDVRAKMEPRLGSDLSSVRVHTGSDSAQAASGLGARAFTVGSDVHFNAGEHAPGTKEGDRLLAHELTHVVQGQRSGIQRKAEHESGGDEGAHGAHGGQEVSQPNEPAEMEADHVADKVADDLHKKEGGDAHGDGKQAGVADAKGGHGGADVKEAPAPISAKLDGVGRKIFRKPKPAPGQKPAKADDPSGPNPNFESDSRAFEVKLGPVAYEHGAAVGPALVAKVRAYIEAKAGASILTPINQLKAELEKLIPKTKAQPGGGQGAFNPAFAGGVATPEDVQQLLMASEELDAAKAQNEHLKDVKAGNLREQMTIVCNFASIINSDLLKADPVELQKWITQAKLSETEIDERLQKAKKVGANPGWPDQPVGQVPSGGTRKQQQMQGAVREQGKTRKENPKPAGGGDHTQTDSTPEQMASQGMPLSDREMRAQGNPGPKVQLKWSEGVKRWGLDTKHKWVQAQQKLGIPLGAGPSGTTNMIMNTGKMLGGADVLSMRMACIGYLLPIHAHTLVEVMTAAAAQGAPFSPGPQMYRRIAPLSEEELRSSCGRSGGKSGNLFPDEKSPDGK